MLNAVQQDFTSPTNLVDESSRYDFAGWAFVGLDVFVFPHPAMGAYSFCSSQQLSK